jgi:hypothetical protein
MKNIREKGFGDVTLRTVQTATGYAGVAIIGGKVKVKLESDDPEILWRRLYDEAVRLSPLFIGYSSACGRFLHFFPEGFTSAKYQGNERNYKLDARKRLTEIAPLESIEKFSGNASDVVRVFQQTNLLSPFEKVRVKSVLQGPDGDAFMQSCGAFAKGDRKAALADLKILLKPHDCAKWTAVTYLPFLWKPDEHVFLKPTMIRTFAERVGHPFAHVYEADLLTVRQPHMASAAVIGETDNGLNPLRGLAKAHASRQV